MKYYDLVFEVEKLYFSWVLHTVCPFQGVTESHIYCPTVTVGYVLSSILLGVSFSFNTD